MEESKMSLTEKIIGGGILGAGLMGVIYIFNHYIAPNLIWFFENTLRLMLLGFIPVALTLFVIFNFTLVKWMFRTIVAKIEAAFIKMDPLSVMDRYIEDAKDKYAGIVKSVGIVTGKKEKLDRQVNQFAELAQKYANLALTARKNGNEDQARVYSSQMVTNQNSVKSLQPLQNKSEAILKMLQIRSDAYKSFIETTQTQVDNKRIEFEIYSETASGLRSAEDLLGSDSAELRMFGASLKELEEQTTAQYGYMVEFERRSKPLIDKIATEKEAIGDEGIRQLEAMIKGEAGGFNLPQRVKIEVQPNKQTKNKYNL